MLHHSIDELWVGRQQEGVDVVECIFPYIQQFKASLCLVLGQSNSGKALQPKSRAQSRQSPGRGPAAVRQGDPCEALQEVHSRQSPGRSPGKVLAQSAQVIQLRRSMQGAPGSELQTKSRAQSRQSPGHGPGTARRGDPGKVQGAVFRCRVAGAPLFPQPLTKGS